ncbi:hypothetical protein Acr_06g0006390 [Actinidia rufa]|uniref:Uncharacterized protein n=1 Tax=Actinidia rufa TaxID=165716 RepID=A0A7J0ERT6_9ERIC|nr:hypothetical protein Acr_06g0006390 [Actinidia rufa]
MLLICDSISASGSALDALGFDFVMSCCDILLEFDLKKSMEKLVVEELARQASDVAVAAKSKLEADVVQEKLHKALLRRVTCFTTLKG